MLHREISSSTRRSDEPIRIFPFRTRSMNTDNARHCSSAIPAATKSALWRQLRQVPHTDGRCCAPFALTRRPCQAEISGASSADLPAPATPIAMESRPPCPSLRMTAAASARVPLLSKSRPDCATAASSSAGVNAPLRSAAAAFAKATSSASRSTCRAVVKRMYSLPCASVA